MPPAFIAVCPAPSRELRKSSWNEALRRAIQHPPEGLRSGRSERPAKVGTEHGHAFFPALGLLDLRILLVALVAHEGAQSPQGGPATNQPRRPGARGHAGHLQPCGCAYARAGPAEATRQERC